MDPELRSEFKKAWAKLIVVEGKKDKRALERLGCKKILTLENKPLYAVVESLLPEKEVVLLTDLDKKGKELYARLYRSCTKRGVRVDNTLRLLLFRERVSHIEGLH